MIVTTTPASDPGWHVLERLLGSSAPVRVIVLTTPTKEAL